jgi:hypothetical protein
MLFSFFEKIVDPFPDASPGRPPQSIVQFCRHYSRGLERWLLIMAGLSTCIAIVEVALFGSLDLRLTVPLLLWIIVYTIILATLLPRLQAVSERQADARATMTGRIADS